MEIKSRLISTNADYYLHSYCNYYSLNVNIGQKNQ